MLNRITLAALLALAWIGGAISVLIGTVLLGLSKLTGWPRMSNP